VLVEAMNMSHIGPNLPLAPSADVSDGMLDVVLLPESNRERFSEYLARRIEGAEQPSDLHVRRVRNATIDPRGSPLHIDDELHSESHEPLEPPGAVEVSAAAGQLTFLIP
jgi:diacylglycerol kinase family enzyme